MKKNMHFISEKIQDYKIRASLILEDTSLTDAEQKFLINRLRLEAMRRYSYYSREEKALDDYIRSEVKKLESGGESHESASRTA